MKLHDLGKRLTLVIGITAVVAGPSTVGMTLTGNNVPATSVTGLVQTYEDANNASFRWNAASGATSYTVTYGSTTTNVTSPFYEGQKLAPGLALPFTVTPVSSSGLDASGAASITLNTLPLEISNLVVDTNYSGAYLYWAAPPSGSLSVEGYSITVTDTSTGNIFKTYTLNVGNPTNFADKTSITGLAKSKFYKFAVTPISQDGLPGVTTVSNPTTTDANTSGLQIVALPGEEQVTLGWVTIPGASSYTLTDGSNTITVSPQTGPNQSAIVSNLVPGTNYTFKITPVLPSGNATTGTISVDTLQSTSLRMVWQSSTSNSMTFGWQSVPGAVSYKIIADVDSPNVPLSITPITFNFSSSATSGVITGLAPATEYFLTKEAVFANGTTAYSGTGTNGTEPQATLALPASSTPTTVAAASQAPTTTAPVAPSSQVTTITVPATKTGEPWSGSLYWMIVGGIGLAGFEFARRSRGLSFRKAAQKGK